MQPWGHRSQARRPRSERQEAGSGVFCCGGRACGLGWQGRAPSVRRARAPFVIPLPLALALPPRSWRPPLYFPLGGQARPRSGGAGSGSSSVGPGGGRRPSASPAQGAPPDPGPGRGLHRWDRRPWRWARRAVPAPRSGSRAARGAKGKRKEIWARDRRQLGKELALKFRGGFFFSC